MNVLFISMCEGKSIAKTRQILDQFALRSGNGVWSTPITQDGLDTVKELLDKSKTKGTHVICRKFSGKTSQVEWMIGSKFNENGAIATKESSLPYDFGEESDWEHKEMLVGTVALASLFHDFGKGNSLFQKKLRNKKTSDDLRHEWVSLCFFTSFVQYCGESDKDWLQGLTQLGSLSQKERDDIFCAVVGNISNINGLNFEKLPAFAKTIAWLMVSHHKLPTGSFESGFDFLHADFFSSLHEGMYANSFDVSDSQWIFKESLFTQKISQKLTMYSEKTLSSLHREDVFSNPLFIYQARLALVVGDHVFSSEKTFEKGFKLYANTDYLKNRALNQSLETHLLGVCKTSTSFARFLPRFTEECSYVTGDNKQLTKRTENPSFAWQDKGMDAVRRIAGLSKTNGAFILNMASTGKGKTLANGKICHALRNEKGSRFNIAIGLRSLTLQTSDVYQKELGFQKNAMATFVDSTAKRIHNLQEIDREDFLDSDDIEDDIDIIGWNDASPVLTRKLKNERLSAMLKAPVVVCTIDHIIRAVEVTRGGKFIVPLLRLASSDLVLDEPDDLSLSDLYALTRLVWLSGLMGSRVILSSATISPPFANGLFKAYADGRKKRALIFPTDKNDIPCVWIDENDPKVSNVKDVEDFQKQHRKFVEKRVGHIALEPIKRRLDVIMQNPEVTHDEEGFDLSQLRYYKKCAEKMIPYLHKNHHTVLDGGGSLSFGLIRIAHIKNLVKLYKHIASQDAPDGYVYHICCYHSRFPMLVRSEIEKNLDILLCRKMSDEKFLEQDFIKRIYQKEPDKHHVFIILASPVAEIGRDHDYDWALVEPSSLRSLIQLSGRVLRHREKTVETTNIFVFDDNIKGSFSKPGFEGKVGGRYFTPSERSVSELLGDARWSVDSRSCINAFDTEYQNGFNSLQHLESSVTHHVFKASQRFYSLEQAFLSGVYQKAFPFRKQTTKDIQIVLQDGSFYQIDEFAKNFKDNKVNSLFRRPEKIDLGIGVNQALVFNVDDLIEKYFENKSDTRYATYGTVRMNQIEGRWLFDESYGFVEE